MYQWSRSLLRKFLLVLLQPFLIGKEKPAHRQPLRDKQLCVRWQHLPNTSQSCSYNVWKTEIFQIKYSITLTKVTFVEKLQLTRQQIYLPRWASTLTTAGAFTSLLLKWRMVTDALSSFLS